MQNLGLNASTCVCLLNRIFIRKTSQSNLSRVPVTIANASLDFADDAMGFVQVWDFFICFVGRTREVQG